MTTTVKVEAHCSTSVEVKVQIIDKGNVDAVDVLQDGESKDYTIYDDREITVKEVPKDKSQAA